jgi:hypothetical protein
MADPAAEAKYAVEKLFAKKSPGYCFPSDEIWDYFDTSEPDSFAKPGIIKRLNSDRYIAATGRITKAISGPRKGSPTKEYTFGDAISEDSLSIALGTSAEADVADITPQTASESEGVTSDFAENENGEFPLALPLQRLIHGCPGSGKSHLLQSDAADAHFVIRTVFHPESSYSDFVGGLRPQSIYKIEDDAPEFIGSTADVPGEPYVQYIIQTGPLLKAYQLACLHPDRSVVLIIEELSRAVAAHVFGDTLQLLDRIEDEDDQWAGYSSYEIEPRPDISSWLAMNEVWNDGTGAGKMRFPPNLYIWATMNRADQNARQLDAAFLRRWEKHYLSYLQNGAFDSVQVPYGGSNVAWRQLRNAINTKLKAVGGIPEDKFIGPYLLSKKRLVDAAALYEDLWGYLWNDVLKNRAPVFFEGAATFAELGNLWSSGDGEPIGPIASP